MTKDVSKQIARLEEQLQTLKAQQLAELREKRRAAQLVVDDLDAQIQAITGKATAVGTRKRTSPAEVKERITGATAKTPLTQKEISDKTSLPYGSVVLFLKRNEKAFKITGQLKQRRFLWKGN
jgi:hypothetical protein